MTSEPKKGVSRFVTPIIRILLGLAFTTFGLNLFLNFIPQPTTPMPEGAMAFAGALAKSGYMMQLIGVTQLIVGLLLLTGLFVPLALALIAPFIVNSVTFHVFLERSGLPMSLVIAVLVAYLAWAYRNAFSPMLAAKVDPA
jgi:uncharacterized membrane protein YphA (DoxX/SURF4 family)